MQTTENDQIALQITGEIRIPTSALAALAKHIQIEPSALAPKRPELPTQPQRLAYNVKQTADLLGVGPVTVYRLMNRGLLKSSTALRIKIIAHSEIVRFLRDTST